jgi:serine/threonine protein kinase
VQIPWAELAVAAGQAEAQGSAKAMHRGVWRGQPVAVLVLRGGATGAQEALLAEAGVLERPGAHPHLTRLHGLTRDPAGGLGLVTEYLPQGSLHALLAEHGGRTADAALLAVGLQVCLALGRLAVQTPPLVHRDVAARNVLVLRLNALDAGPVHVQLSDQGMARQGQSGYYTSGAGGATPDAQPVRWVPPEALLQGRWGEKSDVWAYGVLLWELWSQGELPYYAVKGDEGLIERVAKKGLRLARPEGCPPAVYAVMQRCWELLPANWPTVQQLQSLLMQTLGVLGAAAAQDGIAAGVAGLAVALGGLQEHVENAEFNAQQAAQAAQAAEAAVRTADAPAAVQVRRRRPHRRRSHLRPASPALLTAF